MCSIPLCFHTGGDRFVCTKQFDRNSKKLSNLSSASHQASSKPVQPKGKV